MSPISRPGGVLASRPLHFFWIVDASGSMQGDKIQSLNYAIQSAIPAMREAGDKNPNAQILLRALRFSDAAQWHVAQPTPVEDFRWPDLTAGGVTRMGEALHVLAEELKVLQGEGRILPPVLVLVSDGQPTDDFTAGLRELMAQPLGRKAVRVAIAIGQDADIETLQKFIGHPELHPLQANNAEALVEYIRWASTVAVTSASAVANKVSVGAGVAGASDGAADAVPLLPPPVAAGDDVW
jgi:uncharacterized protein YegL